MAITFQEKVENGGKNITVLNMPTIQGGVDQAYVLIVAIKNNNDFVQSVSGGGLFWVFEKRQCGGRGQTQIEIWSTTGTPTAFTVAVTMNAQTNTIAAILCRYNGVNQSTPTEDTVGHNTNGENGSCSGGTDDASPQLTIGNTKAGSFHVVGLNHKDGNVDSFDASYTQRADRFEGSGGNQISAALYDFENPVTGDDIFTAVLGTDEDWCTIGLALRPALVQFAVDVIKSGGYRLIFTDQDVQKTGEFRLRIPVEIQRTGVYRVIRAIDLSKFGDYRVLMSNIDVAKGGEFRLRQIIDTVLSGAYRLIFADVEVTKSGGYRIENVVEIVKLGDYKIKGQAEVAKLGTYSVGATKDIVKVGIYNLLMVDNDITKSGQYALILEQDVVKSGQYAIFNADQDVVKQGTYNIGFVFDISKLGTYNVLPTFDIVFLGSYRMSMGTPIDVVGQYLVLNLDVDRVLVGRYVMVGEEIAQQNIILPLDEQQRQPGDVEQLDLVLSLAEN